MPKGYNLPESTGPNDPEAPWNKDAQPLECIGCDQPAVHWVADECFCEECFAKLRGTHEEE